MPRAHRLSPLFYAPRGILLVGLQGYWGFGDASNLGADGTANGNNLTNVNSVTQVAGVVGQAASFAAASSQRLTLADNASLSTGPVDWTFQSWLNLASKGANRNAATKNASATVREWLWNFDNAVDRFRLQTYNAAGTQMAQCTGSVLGSPTTGTWYLGWGWQDTGGNLVGCQFNNAGANTVTPTAFTADTTALFSLGAQNTAGATFWDGQLDCCAFWKRLLRTAEKTFLYNAGAGRSHAEMSGYTACAIVLDSLIARLLQRGRLPRPEVVGRLPRVPAALRGRGSGREETGYLRTDRGVWALGEKLLAPERRYWRRAPV